AGGPPPEPWLVPAARLLAVADAYDAMTSDRSYRRAMSKDAAAAELRRYAGAQFDPVVIEHFLAAVIGCQRGAEAA
ncbi:MAG TPA: HD domain-containing phosphohydrolase, partial [Tepidisphaeraceae bacterium]|nr:HD domain-containing phosphohydrolase [Tepidisphaeraceae bacterium]